MLTIIFLHKPNIIQEIQSRGKGVYELQDEEKNFDLIGKF